MKFPNFIKTKGGCWLVLGSIVFALIILLAVLFEHRDEDWCSETLEAGHCERFPTTRDCFCIDTATKNNNSIEWVWIQPDGPRPAKNITWRSDFPGDDQDTNAVITVETREEQDDNDYYTYYNYEYYYKQNNDYQWYGFTTVADDYHPITGIFHICYYALEPSQPKPIDKLELTTLAVKESDTNNDPCKCSSKEEIKLHKVEDSATFSSPGYPNNYCSDSNCRWYISTAKDLAVELDWVVFSLEDGYDFVFVYDGSMADDESAMKEALINTCTGVTCADQRSDTNSMEIHFSADHVTTDLGFKARVTAIGKDPCYCMSNAQIAFVNLHESYTFQSPRYPMPYCKNHHCAWTLLAPAGRGIELSCGHFELEQNDQLTLYDGRDQDGSHRQLSTANCESIISYSEDLHLVFESDDKDSEHLGFSITATSIENYCATTIIHASIGTIRLSDQRPDGFIPIGQTMTLVCPPNTKVAGTIDLITDQLICRATGWHNDRINKIGQMPHCVPVCNTTQLTTPVEDGSDIRICKLPDPTSVKYTKDGQSITVEIYDCTDGCQLTAHENYTCEDAHWQPNNAICHSPELTIMILGGRNINNLTWTPDCECWDTDLNYHYEVDSQMQMCSPVTKECILSKSTKSSDGVPFITKVKIDPVFNDIVLFKQVHMGQIVLVSNGSIHNEMVVLNGDVYCCVWFFYAECYVYRKPAFESKEKIAYYESESAEFETDWRKLVACDNAIYALGGYEFEKVGHLTGPVNSVDKYLPDENCWLQVTPMKYARYQIAATQYKGFIFACGGLIDLDFAPPLKVCERYDPVLDQWTEMTSMIERRGGAAMVAFMDKLYLIGGETIEFKKETLWIDTYDIKNDRWERDGFRLARGITSAYATMVPEIP